MGPAWKPALGLPAGDGCLCHAKPFAQLQLSEAKRFAEQSYLDACQHDHNHNKPFPKRQVGRFREKDLTFR